MSSNAVHTVPRDASAIAARGFCEPGPFQPALRNISFGSCYVYSPRGDGYASAASRLVCVRLKAGHAAWLPVYAGQVRAREVLASWFAKDAVLVPVPGSRPATCGVWAAERLAFALHGVGLGKSVCTALQRRFPVRKSATALNTDRPTVRQHYESFVVTPLPGGGRGPMDRLVLIDDVITRGRTLFAAALRLYEAFPHADIRAFALVRTLGFLPGVTQSLEPCQGVVRWAGGDARREP